VVGDDGNELNGYIKVGLMNNVKSFARAIFERLSGYYYLLQALRVRFALQE
jgi:hypothetical protein